MKTTRERAFETFRSALKTCSIPSPALNGAEAVLREILGLRTLWKEGIALRFADLKESAPCLTCCADPRCTFLDKAGWSQRPFHEA